MEIKTALEGREICYELSKELSKLRYNPDLAKMLHNIENMVTDISKIEVTCRQSRNREVLRIPLNKLNDAVNHFRQLILVAKLMN
jgi:hypothetical protein